MLPLQITVQLSLIYKGLYLTLLILLFASQPVIAEEKDSLNDLKAAYSDIYQSEIIELDIGDAKAFIIKPTKESKDGVKRWIWYAPSLTNKNGTWKLPSKRHAEIMKELLSAGFYFCGVDVGESYGSPKGRAIFTKFYNRLVKRHGFSTKACLFAVSRGGLMHYTWAVEHPQCVQCIGAIYPVCDLQSYPKLKKASSTYGMTLKQLKQELRKHNPIERLAPLAKAGIPIIHLHGDTDKVVPLKENSEKFYQRYKSLGGKMELIIVHGKGHELAPEFWKNKRLPSFFLKHGLAHLKTDKKVEQGYLE